MENCFHYCELVLYKISRKTFLDFTESFHSVKKSTAKNKDENIYVQLFLVNILNFCSEKALEFIAFMDIAASMYCKVLLVHIVDYQITRTYSFSRSMLSFIQHS